MLKLKLRYGGIGAAVCGVVLVSIAASIATTTHDPAVMRLWWSRAGSWLFVIGVVGIIASTALPAAAPSGKRRGI